MAEAGRRLGMTAQAVGMLAQDTAAPVVTRGGRRLCRWPEFPQWYRQKLSRPEKPRDQEDAKTRKLAAEAELAELNLAVARGDFIAVEAVRGMVGPVFDTIRAKLLAIPGRVAPQMVAARTLADARDGLEREMALVLSELSTADA